MAFRGTDSVSLLDMSAEDIMSNLNARSILPGLSPIPVSHIEALSPALYPNLAGAHAAPSESLLAEIQPRASDRPQAPSATVTLVTPQDLMSTTSVTAHQPKLPTSAPYQTTSYSETANAMTTVICVTRDNPKGIGPSPIIVLC